MLKICVCKIDNKGRITLPSTFLKANNIEKGDNAVISNAHNTEYIKIEFEKSK